MSKDRETLLSMLVGHLEEIHKDNARLTRLEEDFRQTIRELVIDHDNVCELLDKLLSNSEETYGGELLKLMPANEELLARLPIDTH